MWRQAGIYKGSCHTTSVRHGLNLIPPVSLSFQLKHCNLHVYSWVRLGLSCLPQPYTTLHQHHEYWPSWMKVRTSMMSPCSMIYIFSIFCNEIFSSRSDKWPGALTIVCDSWRSIYKISFAKNSKRGKLFLTLGISCNSFGCVVGVLFPSWRITPLIFLKKITIKVFFKNNATDIC